MEGVHGRRRKTRMSLKERLGLRGLGCCGATWGYKSTAISVRDDEEEAPEQEQEEIEVINAGPNPSEGISDPGCPATTSILASSGMNLAAALAAERQLREANAIGPSTNGSTNNGEVSVTAPGIFDEAARGSGRWRWRSRRRE
ncbi:uncharacterized protein LOC110654474 [Hevea brasiliensis]|uniref:uncharacterized protein LOC110654474 n=1 Tax=Hevea brasiliensis TaxID=3981 RepID=UPI0025D5F2F1|nr:uncharacterized protein LOC110654474 [Hevea brasiliensis]